MKKVPKKVATKLKTEALNIANVSGSAMQDMMSKITSQFAKMEEELVINVLTQLLKREPTIEDFKKVTCFTRQGDLDQYYLTYNNLKLGTVKKNFGFDGKYGIDFIPFEDKDFLEQATIGTKVTF